MRAPVPLWVLLAASVLVGALPFLFAPRGYHFTSDDYWFAGYGEIPGGEGVCSIAEAFTGDWLTGARGQGGWLRPIPRMVHLANDWVFGLDQPWGYHLTNRLIHGTNGFLLLMLLLRWLGPGSLVAAGGGTLAFLWYPPGAGAVGWVSGRTDLLATFFLLLAMHAAVAPWRARWRYPAVFITTVLACLSKESGFFAPLFVGALLLFFPRGGEQKRLDWWGGLAACAAGAVLVFGWRWYFLGGLGGYGDQIAQRPLGDSVRWLRSYVRHSFWLAGAPQAVAWGALALAAVWAAAAGGRTGWRAAAGGAAIWLLAAVPIVYIPLHMVEEGRLLYISGLALAVSLAGVVRAGSDVRGASFVLGAAGAFVLLSLHSYTRYDFAWRDAGQATHRIAEALTAASDRHPDRPHLAVHEDMDFAVYTQGPLQRNAPGAKILPWDQAKWAVYRHSRGRHEILWGKGGGLPEEPMVLSVISMGPAPEVTSWLAAEPFCREMNPVAGADFPALLADWEAEHPPAREYYAMATLELTEARNWHLPALAAGEETVHSVEVATPEARTRHTFNLGAGAAARQVWTHRPLDSSAPPELHRLEACILPLLDPIPQE